MNILKISDFIDSCVIFHIKECKYINCSNCSFVNNLMEIYILNYRDENYENQAKIMHKFLEENYANFYLIIVF